MCDGLQVDGRVRNETDSGKRRTVSGATSDLPSGFHSPLIVGVTRIRECTVYM